jgi:hypothetical protein
MKPGEWAVSKNTPDTATTGRNTALTYAGAESKFGITCENATPSDPPAARGEADDSDDHEHDQLDPFARPAGPEEDPSRDGDDDDLERGVGDGVACDPEQIGDPRHRRASDPLEHALLA